MTIITRPYVVGDRVIITGHTSPVVGVPAHTIPTGVTCTFTGNGPGDMHRLRPMTGFGGVQDVLPCDFQPIPSETSENIKALLENYGPISAEDVRKIAMHLANTSFYYYCGVMVLTCHPIGKTPLELAEALKAFHNGNDYRGLPEHIIRAIYDDKLPLAV